MKIINVRIKEMLVIFDNTSTVCLTVVCKMLPYQSNKINLNQYFILLHSPTASKYRLIGVFFVNN